MSFLSQIVTYLILLISVLALSACQPAPESESPAIISNITVGSDKQTRDSNYYPNIAAATSSASPGASIQITEGVYIVDNPITLRTKNVKLHGAGADKTIILAKNANQPIFLFEADGITIEAVTINALIDSGPGRASFAIQIQEGYKRCKILQTKILNTAASAIIGHSASGCSLVGNIILNSGDDAVRLRGDRLTVIDNTIVRFFDEALDLASGSDIVVTGNYVANGRIGIVVDDCTNALVSQNYVENQILEGIVTGTDPEATISANTVRNAGNIAYNLYTPQAVTFNQADGAHSVGFRITDMSKGVFFRNSSLGSDRGFVFNNGNGKTTLPKTNTGLDSDKKIISGLSEDITFYDNCEQTSLDGGDTSCAPHYQAVHLARKTIGKTPAAPSQEIYTFTTPLKIEGEAPNDEILAKKVTALLKFYNPGFLSIQIDGELMKSEITAELYETLKATGEFGIGLVRAPFLRFSRGGRRSFLWYLSVGETDVAVVSSIHGGPKVRISLLNENGDLSFLNSIVLLKDKILLKLLK